MTCIYSATSWLLPPTVVGLQFKLHVCQRCDMYVSMLLHVFVTKVICIFLRWLSLILHFLCSFHPLLLVSKSTSYLGQSARQPGWRSSSIFLYWVVIEDPYYFASPQRLQNIKRPKWKRWKELSEVRWFDSFLLIFFCFRWTYNRTAEFSRDPINISKSFCRMDVMMFVDNFPVIRPSM